MNFDADKKTISTLLKSKKRFVIPRFQREYSWEKSQWDDFFNDIINRICIDSDGNIKTTDYFWGTTLFIGDFTDSSNDEMVVVDGQQRLTTITIFLSCLRNALKEAKEDILAKKIQEYIMNEDDNGTMFPILYNENPYPYFQDIVQREDDIGTKPNSDEELNIEKAVQYFTAKLRKPTLLRYIKRIHSSPSNINIVDMYKALRDQLMQGVIISVSTKEKEQANMIFEILNAKGKTLDQIDLIKNQLFSVMQNEQPSDEAKEKWKRLTAILCTRNRNVDISVFYSHYWASAYKNTGYKNLYKDFYTTINKTETTYREFLNDLIRNAEHYIKITNPLPGDFGIKSQCRNIYHYLTFLNDLNIKQSRILVMPLFDAKYNKKISSTEFDKALRNICIFHFIYNGLFSQSTNTILGLYSSNAILLRKAANKNYVHNILKNLYVELGKLLKSIISDTIIQKTSELRYTKTEKSENRADNIKTKFFMRLFYELKEPYQSDASMEHILDEDDNVPESLLLGNIIPLEESINNSIPASTPFREKIDNYYSQSRFWTVKDFINIYGNNDWTFDEISNRSKEIAFKFYSFYLSDFGINL